MPELAAEQAQLEAYVVQGRELQAIHAEALSKVREAVKLRRELHDNAQQLHDRMTAVLKGKLGFKNNDLYSYGIRPRRPRKSSATTTPAPTPTPTPGPPAPQPAAGPAK
jgi:hypothetical protein